MRSRALIATMLLITAMPISAAPVPATASAQATNPPPKYKNFRAAIYIAVNDTRALADRATFDRQYARAASQLHFDKVYIEAYRDHNFATDAELERVKSYFREKGVTVAGGITLAAGGKNGQFGTFDYEDPVDRAECERAVRLAARHFNEVILDDFFFYTSKSDADIAAKGTRSWTQYRLDKMRQVARNLVIDPAKAVNPKVRMIIKYPNWYEHFQGLGYDLDKEAQAFDGIYTGTETRDPTLTDQLLQQYESYEIIRYYNNIRPSGNGGGWVDTFSTRSVDRYAEQLWDTLLAKAPEITLFKWHPMSDPDGVDPGKRPWKDAKTSFDWTSELNRWRASNPDAPAGWGRAAGYALEKIDPLLGKLGNPVGIASYKPFQSSGEDFLHNFLGNIGIPIELQPTYPANAKTVLLTEAAAADPTILEKIKSSLKKGADVIITSGLVQALAGKGFSDLAEWTPTGRIVSVAHFVQGFGAGNGQSLDDPGTAKSMLVPEIRFYTNDSWATIRAVAGQKAYPILLMNHYSKGTLFMLTVPENQSDLYRYPQAALTQIRSVAGRQSPVIMDAPSGVALFTYDNRTFVVQNYRDTPVKVRLGVQGTDKLVSISGGPAPTHDGHLMGMMGDGRSAYMTLIPAHSLEAFQIAH